MSIRPYLEHQADRVEAALEIHRAPGRVVGGVVSPRYIRFFLDPAPHVRFASIRALTDDLALALRVPSLRIERGEEGIVLEFPHPHPQPVKLLSLLPKVMPIPRYAALLGMTDDGLPLLARLSSPLVSHILIAGTTGSGKSVLLRAIAASLLLTHSPDTLQMFCLDPKGRAFDALNGAPHLKRRPIRELPEACEALDSLVRVMEVRDRRGERPISEDGGTEPRLIVMIDELAEWVMQGGRTITEPLTRLLQRGREAGIHVVAATQRPAAAVLSGLMRANFPFRLVGRVVTAEDARVAAGRGGTRAQYLRGRGDFLVVSGESLRRFQVAYIGEQELMEALAHPPRAIAFGGKSEALPLTL